MIAVLSLNPAVDKIVSLRDLRWGEHIRVKKIRQVAAGKGINVARVIKKLGGDVVVIGVSGGPNGEWIKDELKKEKLKFDFVRVSGNVRESLTLMDEERGREIHLREDGSIITQGELNQIKNKLKKWSPLLRFVVISGTLPTGVPVDFYREIIAFFKKKKVPVLLDANGPAFAAALKAKPDYIKPNLNELEELAGKRLKTRGEEVRFIKGLLKRGIDMVFVTHGPGDAIVMTPDWGLALTPPRVRVRNTVGSGDAVAGALAYEVTKGRDIHPAPQEAQSVRPWCGVNNALKRAIACGSANTLSIGAGFLDIKKVNILTKKVNVKVLYNHGD